ncbi:MAG: hypothetical protein ABR525_04135 [Candidatus Limnocylindria bacterium]
MRDLLRGRGRRTIAAALAFALTAALVFGLVARQGSERTRQDIATADATPAPAVIFPVSPTSSTAAGSPAVSPAASASASPQTEATPLPEATQDVNPPPASSIPLAKPTVPPATPTPPPQDGSWRVEGVVVDAQGNPVQGVCVAVGPHGCQSVNPKTDARGVYWVDLPQVTVNWDFHFIKDGYVTADRRITPTGPIVLNVEIRS